MTVGLPPLTVLWFCDKIPMGAVPTVVLDVRAGDFALVALARLSGVVPMPVSDVKPGALASVSLVKPPFFLLQLNEVCAIFLDKRIP